MRFTLLLFIGFLPLALFSQDNITGKVVDQSVAPIPFANVILHDKESSELVKGAVTEEDGSFEIVADQGNYYIEISYLGYATQRADVDQRDMGTITLSPQDNQLEDVTIRAQRPFLQREHDKLVVNVEGNIMSQGTNTLEMLRKSPGVILDQDDNITLSGKNGVRIYIDDKDTRLGGAQLTDLLRSMPSNSIEKIEIITNPSARYEAQGNAGVINIVTKKSKFFGTNGTVSVTPGLGRYFRWEHSISANHRTEKYNLHGRYSYAKRNQYMEIVQDRSFLDADGAPLSVFKLQNDFKLPVETHMPRLGLDISLSERSSLNFLYSGVINNTGSVATNSIREFNNQGTLLSDQLTDTDVGTVYNQHTGNVNFNHTFSNKSNIDIDLDIASYGNDSEESYASTFNDGQGGLLYQDQLDGVVDGFLDLKGVSLDYTLPLASGSRVEMGIKNTWVTTDNDLAYQNTIDGTTRPNDVLSNRFIYKENINGAYVNYNMSKEKWNAQLGLRGEQSYISGDQRTTGETFKNDYFNLFPSAAFNYTANPNRVVGFSVSRRIDRPGYQQLNPLRFFVNTNTFRVGNPFLRPQYTWTMGANLTLKQRYYIGLNYGYTQDNLDRAIIREGAEEIVSVTHINVDKLQSLALTISAPLQISSRWSSHWNLNSSLLKYDSPINGFQFDRINPITVLNTSHNFDLGQGWRMQLGGFFLFPHWASITEIEELWAINWGVQKDIADRKGNIRLSVNDIFYTQYPKGRTNFGGIDDHFISYRDSRYASLSFSWKFGKLSVRPARRRQNAIQDELNRARQEQS